MLMTDDFFCNCLDQLIDLCHPLAVLASCMHLQEIEASLAHRFARQVLSGKKIEDIDMFGATQIAAVAGFSNVGLTPFAHQLNALAALFQDLEKDLDSKHLQKCSINL